MLYVESDGCDLLRSDETLHLLIFMLSCQELAHEARRSRDCCRLTVQFIISIILYSFTSSAKSLILTLSLHTEVMSLMNIKNKVGPKTEP
jgi:hypothetical protein